MKNIILIFIVLYYTTSTYAQQKYIDHIVKKGESIRDISEKHGIKSEDILRLNPELKIEQNTIVKIPNLNYKEEEDILITPYINHIVQSKETLYGISKMYNVNIDSLKHVNPSVGIEGLKIGMMLKIPNNELISEKEKQTKIEFDNPSNTKTFELHEVVEGDTYYSLANFYEVTEEQLKTLNPELSEGLRLGMILKIREKNKPVATSRSEAELNSLFTATFKDSIPYGKHLNVSMLLPFEYSKKRDLDDKKLFSSKNNLINIITDFYLGAEIAIDSLRSQGLSISLKVYDSENDKDEIQELIDSKAFENTDVLFGPVYSKHADTVASKLENIPVVFPFYSSRQEKFTKNNLIKTYTEREYFEDLIINHIKKTYTDEQIIIVGDSKSNSKLKIETISELLKENDSIKNIYSIQPEEGYIDKENFLKVADTLEVNWVLLATNDKVVTSGVINNLKSLPSAKKVKLFAFEKSNNFEKIDSNTLAKMNFTYAVMGIFNENLPEVSNFYNQYLQKNNTYPSKHAIRGFDVVYDILMRMTTLEEGNSLINSPQNASSMRLENTFIYHKKISGGPTYNKAAYLQKYNEDLYIEVLRE